MRLDRVPIRSYLALDCAHTYREGIPVDFAALEQQELELTKKFREQRLNFLINMTVGAGAAL